MIGNSEAMSSLLQVYALLWLGKRRMQNLQILKVQCCYPILC